MLINSKNKLLGCFEYYANFHRHDANLSRYLKANEWLASYDMFSGEMWTEREFALAEYIPFMLVGFYPLFQERGRPKLERPKATWDVSHQVPVELCIRILTRLCRTAPCDNHSESRYLCVTCAVRALGRVKVPWRLQTPRQRSSPSTRSSSIPKPHHFPSIKPRMSPFVCPIIGQG